VDMLNSDRIAQDPEGILKHSKGERVRPLLDYPRLLRPRSLLPPRRLRPPRRRLLAPR